MNKNNFFSRHGWQAGITILAISTLAACQTTQTGGVRDYSHGIDVTVPASNGQPAYRITEKVGPAGTGYAFMLQKVNGMWRVMYDAYNAKAFAKQVGNLIEVPEGSEVLWSDGKRVVPYFSPEPVAYSRQDGSFPCPRSEQERGHRACRSAFTEAKSLLDALSGKETTRPFVLNYEEIKKAVAEANVLAVAAKRMALDKQ
jgi:hypothetical protein